MEGIKTPTHNKTLHNILESYVVLPTLTTEIYMYMYSVYVYQVYNIK